MRWGRVFSFFHFLAGDEKVPIEEYAKFDGRIKANLPETAAGAGRDKLFGNLEVMISFIGADNAKNVNDFVKVIILFVKLANCSVKYTMERVNQQLNVQTI